MTAAILVEVSTLGETMWKIYDRFVTIHKAIIHLHGLQRQSKEFVKTLKNIQVVITYVQEWTMWYKWAPLDLEKMMKPQVDPEKEMSKC